MSNALMNMYGKFSHDSPYYQGSLLDCNHYRDHYLKLIMIMTVTNKVTNI